MNAQHPVTRLIATGPFHDIEFTIERDGVVIAVSKDVAAVCKRLGQVAAFTPIEVVDLTIHAQARDTPRCKWENP